MVTNLDINTLAPALKLRRIVVELIAATDINNPDEQVHKLRTIARENGVSLEALLSAKVDVQDSQHKHEFDEAVSYVLEKNAELYRRLA